MPEGESLRPDWNFLRSVCAECLHEPGRRDVFALDKGIHVHKSRLPGGSHPLFEQTPGERLLFSGGMWFARPTQEMKHHRHRKRGEEWIGKWRQVLLCHGVPLSQTSFPIIAKKSARREETGVSGDFAHPLENKYNLWYILHS